MTWRTGIPLIIVSCLIGSGMNFLLTRDANGAPATPVKAAVATTYLPAGEIPPGCNRRCDRSTSPRDGVADFKAGRLGRQPANVRYTRQQKKWIVDAIMRWQRSRSTSARVAQQRAAASAPWISSRADAWETFKTSDTCAFYAAQAKWGSATTRGGPVMTCAKKAWAETYDGPMSPWEVKIVGCGGVLALQVKATPIRATNGWGWASIGAGGVLCLWQDVWLKTAEENQN